MLKGHDNNMLSNLRRRAVVSSFICQSATSSSPFQVAIFKRSETVRTYKGKWAACSGSIETSDTSPEDAARREIYEETTLSRADLTLLRAGRPFSIVDAGLQTEWVIHPFAFELTVPSTRIIIEWEHTEYKFIDPRDLHHYETVPHLWQSLWNTLVGPTTERGLKELKTDNVRGAGQLAVAALQTLLEAVRGKDLFWARTDNEVWEGIKSIAWHLAKTGRPAMRAAIQAQLLRALVKIKAEIENGSAIAEAGHDDRRRVAAMKFLAQATIENTIAARSHTLHALVEYFISYIDGECLDRGKDMITFLTLSSSSSVTRCFEELLKGPETRKFNIKLYVLESRPLCEGVGFVTTLLTSLRAAGCLDEGAKNATRRFSVEIVADAAVGKYAPRTDFIILGADLISRNGDVSNKIGSLPAAALAKTLNPDATVVVVSETDKIADLEADSEEHDPHELITTWTPSMTSEKILAQSEHVKVRNIYFDWVPSAFIDRYVTEQGVLRAADVEWVCKEKSSVEERIFGKF